MRVKKLKWRYFLFIKYSYLIACIFNFCIIFSGCGPKDISTKEIADLLFKDVIGVKYMEHFPEFKEMNDKDISILKKSIQNSSYLSSVPNEEMPTTIFGYVLFKIQRENHSSVEIYYSKKDGYMFVTKIQVHENNRKKYEQRLSTFKKYLDGAYKFRPSNEINFLMLEL